MLSREQAIKHVFNKHGESAIYVTNTGYLSRAIYDLYPENKNILYMQGSMGLSPAIALGIAKSTSRQVVAFVGDASLLMHLGITHTIRDQKMNNLFVYVVDNGCHESVGGYECSPLEEKYAGITDILKITNDGKKPRVGTSWEKNIKDVVGFINEKILLNPGPTNTLSCVKEAQTFNSDICHRTDDFSALLKETKQNLLTRFSKNANLNEWNITIFGGSGTAAMEALVSTLINQTSVIIAGKYGQRSSEMMDLYNIQTEKIFCNNIEELKINKQYKTVYFVENETTTGEKFDLKNMSRLYPNCKFFIDATSAFGATDYKKYLNKINALSFCSNKCLQSTPGLGIVIWRKDLKTYNKNYYLNLNKYVNKMPFTLPVQSIAALNKSLKSSIMSQETYDQRKNKLISDFMAIGIECVNKKPSNSVIGFTHPCRDYNSLKNFLKSRNIVIYDGIDGIKNSFRVATMSVLFEREYDYILRCFNDSCVR